MLNKMDPFFNLFSMKSRKNSNIFFWKSIIKLLNLDNFSAPIEFEGVESISHFSDSPMWEDFLIGSMRKWPLRIKTLDLC